MDVFHLCQCRSAEDANVYLVNDIQDPLQVFFDSLVLRHGVDGLGLEPSNPRQIQILA